MSSMLAMHGVRHLELGAMHTSHAQLGRAPVSMHISDNPAQKSVLNATDFGGVGVLRHAPAPRDVERPQMSAAVLLAAQNLARELQELQDDFLAEHYSQHGELPPADSKYIQSSWAQMSVLDSLMGQLHSEVAREASHPSALKGGYSQERHRKQAGHDNDWREALHETSESTESRRLSKWVQQDNAARLIQHAWRQYRLRGVIRSGMRRKWELHRKYVTTQMTSSVEEDLRHRRQLAMRDAAELKTKERGGSGVGTKPGSDPLAGWQATVPGLRGSWVNYNSQPKAVLSAASSPEPFLPEVVKHRSEPKKTSTRKIEVPFLPEIPAPHAEPVQPRQKKNRKKKKAAIEPASSPRGYAGPRKRTAAGETTDSKASSRSGLRPTPPTTARSAINSRPKTTPVPVRGSSRATDPMTFPRRRVGETPYATTQSVDYRDEQRERPSASIPQRPMWRASCNSNLGHDPVDGTGLWRKSRARLSAVNLFPHKDGFFSADRGHGHYLTPRFQPSQERTPVQKWQSAANRSKRVEGAWRKFQAFDSAVTQWVDHNRMLLEQQAKGQGGRQASREPSAQTAGDFLLVASSLHRLCRQSITSAATHVSRKSSVIHKEKGEVEEDGNAMKLIKLSSVTLNPKLLHHQLAAECVPVKVALGQVKPLVVLKRSLERARLAEASRRS